MATEPTHESADEVATLRNEVGQLRAELATARDARDRYRLMLADVLGREYEWTEAEFAELTADPVSSATPWPRSKKSPGVSRDARAAVPGESQRPLLGPHEEVGSPCPRSRLGDRTRGGVANCRRKPRTSTPHLGRSPPTTAPPERRDVHAGPRPLALCLYRSRQRAGRVYRRLSSRTRPPPCGRRIKSLTITSPFA